MKKVDLSLFYIPVPDRGLAQEIARSIVQKKIVACVNLIPQIHSFYEWEGSIQESTEYLLIAKGIASQFPKLEAEIRRLHSHECPAVLQINVQDANADFLSWVAQSAPNSNPP